MLKIDNGYDSQDKLINALHKNYLYPISKLTSSRKAKQVLNEVQPIWHKNRKILRKGCTHWLDGFVGSDHFQEKGLPAIFIRNRQQNFDKNHLLKGFHLIIYQSIFP